MQVLNSKKSESTKGSLSCLAFCAAMLSSSLLFAADIYAPIKKYEPIENPQPIITESQEQTKAENATLENIQDKEPAALIEDTSMPEFRDYSSQVDKKHKVNDIAYGEILFDYFNNDFESAIVKTRTAQQKNSLRHNSVHTELLLAQLYILEGLPAQAEKTLIAISKNRVSDHTRNLALYQLVRIYTYQGKLQEAQHLLETQFSNLNELNDLERKILLANIYTKQKNAEGVKQILAEVDPAITRNAYMKYNFAADNLNIASDDLALPVLQELGQGVHEDLESRSIKDFANLTLGVYHLKHEELEEAKTYFKAVGYIGPHSTAALYYISWIELKEDNLKAAFAYLVDLSQRNPTDPYVGKSFLLRPYALEKIGSTHLALSGYLKAYEIYDRLINDVDTTINIINSDVWLEKLSPPSLESISMYEKIPPKPGWIDTQTNEANFLIDLYASDSFAVMYQNFWELELLNRDLKDKNQKFAVLQLQKETHDTKFSELAPEAKALLSSRRIQLIENRLQQINQQITDIAIDNDFLAAPTPEQASRLNKIAYLHSILDKEPADQYLVQRRYLHYLEGVNAWNMSQNSFERQWKIKKQYKELKDLLDETETHKQRIQLGIDNIDYYQTIMPRLNRLSLELEIRIKQTELLSLKIQKQMRQEALAALEERKKEYKTLKVRSRLSAARLQDSVVTGGKR